MYRVLRRWKVEFVWGLALLATIGWYAVATQPVRAQGADRIYHTYTNWCYEYPLDCLWDPAP